MCTETRQKGKKGKCVVNSARLDRQLGRFVLTSVITWVFGLALAGCRDSSPGEKRVYFKPLIAPAGIAVDVISDVSLDVGGGGTIGIRAVVQPTIDRDDLDRLMRSFFEQAKARRRPRETFVAKQIDVRFYESEAKAKEGGDDWLGQALMTPTQKEVAFNNRQKPPLLRWAMQALGPQPQYTGTLQPRVLADTEQMSLEVTLPFVKYDGSGEPAEHVSFQQATTSLAATSRALFEGIPDLQSMTFVGSHHGDVAIRVRMTRHHYRQLNLGLIEERLGELRGQLMELYVAGKVSEKAMERQLNVRRQKLYRQAIALLPEQNVTLAAELR